MNITLVHRCQLCALLFAILWSIARKRIFSLRTRAACFCAGMRRVKTARLRTLPKPANHSVANNSSGDLILRVDSNACRKFMQACICMRQTRMLNEYLVIPPAFGENTTKNAESRRFKAYLYALWYKDTGCSQRSKPKTLLLLQPPHLNADVNKGQTTWKRYKLFQVDKERKVPTVRLQNPNANIHRKHTSVRDELSKMAHASFKPTWRRRWP